MKKILFAIAAIAVMVCTAVSLSSCGDDESTNKMQCTGYWTVALQSTKTESATTSSLLVQLNSRVASVLGSSFKLDYDQETLLITDAAAKEVAAKFDADSQTQEILKKLEAEECVSDVLFIVKCGDKTVGKIIFVDKY